MMQTRICTLFDIHYPIIQAGMVWCSGWRLAAAVSEYGGLGIIGAGSMYPDVLQQHIQKCKQATSKPFAVNVPLLYPDIDQLMACIVEEQVPIVFTSAGNPKIWTSRLKENGIKVAHVVSSAKFAQKSEAAGVDAVVAEGFEAGGHNGREETTTFCLIPLVKQAVSIPVIAAGGIGSGQSILAAMALGAEGVQIGSLFAASKESSAHEYFKNAVVEAKEGDTMLTMKQLTPVRLIKNDFFQRIHEAEQACCTKEELAEILGKRRAKKGIFEGDLVEGELEIGQISASIEEIKSVRQIMDGLINDFELARKVFAAK